MSAAKRPTAKKAAAKASAAGPAGKTLSSRPVAVPVDAKLEQILAASPSPFSDAVLQNTTCMTPDVPQIHATVRERCLALVHEARRDNRTSLQVVLGEAGEGKTHLIAWLRRQSEEGWRKETATGRFALTVIPPTHSLARAHHHVLQEVVRQLSIRLPDTLHFDAATDTPIEIVIWRALLAVARLLLDERGLSAQLRTRLEEVTATNPDRFLSSCVEQLREAWKVIGTSFIDAALRLPALAAVDRDVFRTVARFPEGDEPERTRIVDWLGGGSLSAERLEELGTSLILDEEAEAARALKTVLALAQLAGTPVALAFDQIEGVARLGPDAIGEFLDTITEIFNQARGTVLLVFCQSQLWPELMSEAANHVRDRLHDSLPINLRALTPEEVLLLVETRMKHFWEALAQSPDNPLYPLTREQILQDAERTALRSARAVVRYYHSLLREPPERRVAFVSPASPPPTDLVRRKLDALIEEERRTTRSPDARAELVQAVAFDVLQQAQLTKKPIGGAVIASVSRHRVKKTSAEGVLISIQRNEQKRTAYVESTNSLNGRSASATVKRFDDAVETKQADTAILLREEAFPLPAAANRALLEMTPRGALLRLREDELAPIAAIDALLNAAASGDLPVDRKTALDIVLEHLGAKLDLVPRIVSAAFPSTIAVDTPPASAQPVRSIKVPSISFDPATLEALSSSVLEHLRVERAFEPATQLAARLGMSVEKVDAAIEALEARGLVDVVVDRNRAPVVLLRPEGLSQ